MDKFIRYWLDNKFFIFAFVGFIIIGGYLVSPFDHAATTIERNPIAVDAIPDISENQQIVFTQWPGRSPSDIDDQVTYPLTVSLLGLPGVKTVRSYSNFGFSMIYVIFKEDVEFYWSRSRILEKLNSLPSGTLPKGAVPTLGPDATALGQVFWYTLEGRDKQGNPTGGWDLDELRSIQDWIVRYALMSAEGVSEVSSVGGFVKEYQVDVDPNAMRAYSVNIDQVFQAIQMGNRDVGARTIEVNNVEYMIRGIGFIKSVDDIEDITILSRSNTPVRIKDVAHVTLGPALRRGVLDKAGAEAVGGVAVVRFGDNPLQVIKNLKQKIEAISPGLPEKTLADGTVSKVTIVPFYDRTTLIYETLNTLSDAINQQVLITLIVIILLILNIRVSFIIGLMLPLTVLMTFLAMKLFEVDANIVALSGIAIAVGTIVDMAVVLCENIARKAREKDSLTKQDITEASSEVASSIVTAALTTIVSFLPIFTMVGAEGKLFSPLAYTKTFVLFSSIILTISVLPVIAHLVYSKEIRSRISQLGINGFGLAFSIYLIFDGFEFIGLMLAILCSLKLLTILNIVELNEPVTAAINKFTLISILMLLLNLLTTAWEPIGASYTFFSNLVFVIFAIGIVIASLYLFQRFYDQMLRWCLAHPLATTLGSFSFVVFGALCWLGFSTTFQWLPASVADNKTANEWFPGLGKEFMPSLDEGSFLYMPTTMPHAGLSEVNDILKKQDMAISAIPEVKQVVGKLGRADSPLDSAPISMIETIINYHPEYKQKPDGTRGLYAYDNQNNKFLRDANNQLIEDSDGRPFRIWRDHIKSPDDIWNEIYKVAQIPGVTNAPKLQPIETRILMLQSGFRAPMGIKVYGPDLESIETFSLDIEKQLKQVQGIKPETVFAERIVGKPYLEIHLDRKRISRYGIHIQTVQNVIEVAVGGKRITTTVEGRERYPVRVRYMRELRDSIESLEEILIPSPSGVQIPLRELADIQYVRGPQVIKSEDTFLVGYVIFDRISEFAEVSVVANAEAHLKAAIEQGNLKVPEGISYRFSGSYENQIRASKTLALVLPVSLLLIFLLLYIQFKSIIVSLISFSGVFIAWSGGFILLWLYGKSWFMDIDLLGLNLRHLFNIEVFNLSVAVWVGFLALFGIATDNGVILASRIKQSLTIYQPTDRDKLIEAIVKASNLRLKACLMTTATTIIALMPILTSKGRGADIMIPMAIPSVGGMLAVLLTLFIIPVLYFCAANLVLNNKQQND